MPSDNRFALLSARIPYFTSDGDFECRGLSFGGVQTALIFRK